MLPISRGARSSAGLRAALATLLATTLGGCAYDAAERCGPAMELDDELSVCVCAPDAIPVEGGCQPCDADEIAAGGQCVCPAGQVKNGQDVCEEVAGLGDPCDGPTACQDATYDHCAIEAGESAGYCTRTCVDDSECQGVYTCTTWDATPYCKEFTGVGATCADDEDCAGFDAQFCAPMDRMCIVAGCSMTDGDCPKGYECCDFSAFGIGTLCVPPDRCPQ